MMRRRDVLLGALAATSCLGAGGAIAGTNALRKAHVVVVGGGFGGATAAKYLRMLSSNRLRVTLVEPRQSFVSLPLSNLVVGGNRRVADLTVAYEALTRRHGVEWRRSRVQSFDAARRSVHLDDGTALTYDRLVMSPGISLDRGAIAGLGTKDLRDSLPVGWTDATEAAKIHAALAAMPDGGVFAMTIPEAPLRCPPAPYERATQAAHWLRVHNPRAKVLVFDANADILSEANQFRSLWASRFGDSLEYHPQFNCTEVVRNAGKYEARFELGETVTADVLNVIPPMSAADIVVRGGLATANGRWCDVDFLTFASKVVPRVHVLGDAIQIAPQMPKSGQMANQHAKVCAAAIVADLAGRPVNPEPVCFNLCFSFVSNDEAMHIAGEHRYDPVQRTMLPVLAKSDVSIRPTRDDFARGMAWAQGIWADMLA
ncbi:flavocytochrome C [Pandoraea terrigena]|uniref:Flavocytochrome C n=2 Tax=Pandoraea terrigena TaxID=2508292 RepID=A0A5E4VVY8_9BURK|nr:flavocytochrome C [Pandoraea terrigena]